MTVPFVLKRVFQRSPKTTIKCALKLLVTSSRRWKQRISDDHYGTFPKIIPNSNSSNASNNLNSCFQSLSVDNLEPYREILSIYLKHILRHEFNLLGSGWIRVYYGLQAEGLEGIGYPALDKATDIISFLNKSNRREASRLRAMLAPDYEPIDWQIDFRSGYRWKESAWYRDIRYGEKIGADIKIPWELSRLQHLPSLALAYKLAKAGKFGFEAPERYLLEFQHQVLDFIAANPPRYGVCWVCPMDIAIRVINLIVAYDLFSNEEAHFDSSFVQYFVSSIQAHARHIEANLEWSSTGRGNHYLCNVAGLLFAGVWLSRSTETERWINFGTEELLKETTLQFNQDGSNVEGSTCYHRLSSEVVLWSSAILLKQGYLLPNEHLNRLRLMIEFTRAITKPDGTIPQIGDNDSGRLLKLIPTAENLDSDLKQFDLIEMGRVFFNRAQEFHSIEAALLHNLLSKGSLPLKFVENQIESETKPSVSFPDFGLYILRNTNFYVAVRSGGGGWYTAGNHTHNDQLSFDLSVNGKNFIIDTGTYVYSSLPDRRNQFRSTKMHNTLVIEGLEQNSWQPGMQGLFRLENQAKGKLLHFGEDEVQGEHRGYGFPYQRKFVLQNEQLRVTEHCSMSQNCTLYFHLDPLVSVVLKAGKVVLSRENVSIELFSISGMEQGEWVIENSETSLSYGCVVPTKLIKWQGLGKELYWTIKLVF